MMLLVFYLKNNNNSNMVVALSLLYLIVIGKKLCKYESNPEQDEELGRCTELASGDS
jgi:hypothetical protein